MKIHILLTRDDFRNNVFTRDNYKCVICDEVAVDAHHILERRLWPDGGYYIDNGASVCEEHHILCETTEISVEQIREAAKITNKIIPPHMYDDQIYDKWGNIILENGQRLKGELFFDESVQKILKKGKVLELFTNWVKYPRTYHLPWSENMNEDDRMMEDVSIFKNKRVIITEKMDGENTTLYRDYNHARSIDSRTHESRSWVKQFWSKIRYNIPDGWRVCGENMYAKHSIFYESLPSYFLGFSVWADKNICLNWDDTLEYFSLLDITSVPVIFDGTYDETKIKSLYDNKNWENQEGYVMRLAEDITYYDFRKKVGKFVRKSHIQTINHWMYGKQMNKNLLK